MTTGNLYLDLFIGGLIGITCHVFLLKLPALKRRAEKANTAFSVGAYFKNDWLTLVGSLLTVVVAMYVLDELLAYTPSVERFLKFGFVFIGYTGSSILQGFFSRTENKIQQIVDEKTNKADNKN